MDWTAIASIAGAVLTAVTAIVTLAVNQYVATKARSDDVLRSAVASLTNEQPTARSLAVPMLVRFSRDKVYFADVLQSLCTVIRFERDIYFIQRVFEGIGQLGERNASAVQQALSELRVSLVHDLLRQIGEYAADHHVAENAIGAQVAAFSPEGRNAIEPVINANSEELRHQIAASELLALPDGRSRDVYRKWSVRITSASIVQLDHVVRHLEAVQTTSAQ